MTCAIYARVSTSDKGQNPENQLQELRRFAATQGWAVVEEFVDYESGGNSQRAGFLKNRAKPSKVCKRQAGSASGNSPASNGAVSCSPRPA